MFVCAKGEAFSFAKQIGVGLVDSAIGLTDIVLRDSPNIIIFIGSAGSYSDDVSIFDIFTSYKATQIESSFIKFDSYTPIDNKIENVSCETNIKHHSIFGDVIVNSSNYITTNKEIATAILKADILLENMEFFSVLRVAQYFKIPAFGVFCVTNYCDSNAHSFFIKHHKKAKQYLESYIREHYGKYL